MKPIRRLKHPGHEFICALNVAGESCERQIEDFFSVVVGQPVTKTLIINLALAIYAQELQGSMRHIQKLKAQNRSEEAAGLLRTLAERQALIMEQVRRAGLTEVKTHDEQTIH